MTNLKKYKTNIKNWDKTLESYVDWVAKTSLREYFSEEIKINNFSLWWTTNICAKDNMVKNKWYYDLKERLIEKKKIKFNKLNFYLLFFIKFLKNFITHFVWFSIIKFLSFSRYKEIKRKNCFHSINFNFLKKNDFLSDRCYGNAPFTNYQNHNFHVVTISKKRHFINNFLKKKKYKKNIPYVVADEYLSVFNVLYIYFKILVYFFKLKLFLNRNKKIFFINKIDCGNVLEPLLLMSFAGEIQNQLFNSLSINNFFKKNIIELFITYAEFNPGLRSIYFFVRDMSNPPKIISIQHGQSTKNMMYHFHKKNEFTKNKVLEGKYFSPSPDFYLTQGKQYNTILKSYFRNKTEIIGSLKYDVFKFKKNNDDVRLNSIKFQQKRINKKIILLCPTIGDDLVMLEYLKESVNFDFRFILSPHPTYKKQIIKKYLYELRDKCELEIYNDISSFDLLSISNLVICGFSSLAHEALFFGVPSVRIVNSSHPQFFDLRDQQPIACSSQQLKKILNKKYFLSIKNSKIKKIKKNYFFKLDNKSHQRFWNFVEKISKN